MSKRIMNLQELSAARRGRGRRGKPMSQGGIIALAIIGAAVLIVTVWVAMYLRAEYKADRQIREAQKQIDKVLEGYE